TARLRFGDDTHGRAPLEGLAFATVYRTGSGPAGNIGAPALGHIVTADSGIPAATNPGPAGGGPAPEPRARVRTRAPQPFRPRRRAAAPAAYALAAAARPDVQKAVATLRWPGAWPTVFLTVDRAGGRPIDADFEAELRR